jgi:hypothetical protein
VIEETDDTPSAPAPLAPSALAFARKHELVPRMRALSRSYAQQVAAVCRLQVQRIGPTGATGVALIILAAALLWSTVLPQRHRLRELQEQLQTSVRTPTQRPSRTSGSVEEFVAALPGRAQVPAIVATVVEKAEKAGLALDSGRYELQPGQSGRIERYRLTFPVQGAYPQVRDFIDGALVAVPAMAMDSLRLEREGIAQGGVAAEVSFIIYVRTGQ